MNKINKLVVAWGIMLVVILWIICHMEFGGATKEKRSVKEGGGTGVRITLEREEGKDGMWQFDLCQVIDCGKDQLAWRGHDVYGCLWPSTIALPNGPWCHTWHDVNWKTVPFTKKMMRNSPLVNPDHIQNRLRLSRGYQHSWGGWKNTLIISLKNGNDKPDTYITLGVDVEGKDPLGLIKISVKKPKPTGAPIITDLTKNKKKVIQSTDYSKLTPLDLMTLETGYHETNLWLEWVTNAAEELGFEGCLACAAGRPQLNTEPAPLHDYDSWGYKCMLKLTKEKSPKNCTALSNLYPPAGNESSMGVALKRRKGNYTCFNLTTSSASKILVGAFKREWCGQMIQEGHDKLGGWGRVGLYYACGEKVVLARIEPTMEGVCAMIRVAVPMVVIGNRAINGHKNRRKRSVNSDFDLTRNSPTYIDAIGIPRGVPDEYKLADQVAAGFENIPVIAALFPVTPNKNVDRINYIHYNVQRLSNLTRDAVSGLKEQLAATSLMTIQNRLALDMLLSERGGVCSMFKDTCCTVIPNNTAPDGSVSRALEGLKELSNELKASSGIENAVSKWMSDMFGEWKGVIIAMLTSMGIFLGILVTCGCCCIPCIRSLINRLIITAIEKKENPPPYQMPLLAAAEGDDVMEEVEELLDMV